MARNIIFIILFVVLYGGLVLLGTQKKDDTLVDRKGYGTLTDEAYDCERFSIKMKFEPEWIVFDGVSADEIVEMASNGAFLTSASSFGFENAEFILGIATPEAVMSCVCIENSNFQKSTITESGLRSTVEYIKKSVEANGGIFGNSNCKSISAQGNGNKMIIFYFDYELFGERTSAFVCYTNSGKDGIMISGAYENIEGLDMLSDFVENNVTIYSEYTTAL
ncbi:MAG: hypothetical protein IJX15_01930 [Ruminiclostridium sp.]|nr:hypothetical protein [Ruminiclostridium sp.]